MWTLTLHPSRSPLSLFELRGDPSTMLAHVPCVCWRVLASAGRSRVHTDPRQSRVHKQSRVQEVTQPRTGTPPLMAWHAQAYQP